MTVEYSPSPNPYLGKKDVDLDKDYRGKRRGFFHNLAFEVKRIMYPLFYETGANEKEWKNVRQHTLVVIARASKLAEALDLPSQVIQDLKLAASIHDFDKPSEVAQVKSSGASIKTFTEVARL